MPQTCTIVRQKCVWQLLNCGLFHFSHCFSKVCYLNGANQPRDMENMQIKVDFPRVVEREQDDEDERVCKSSEQAEQVRQMSKSRRKGTKKNLKLNQPDQFVIIRIQNFPKIE